MKRIILILGMMIWSSWGQAVFANDKPLMCGSDWPLWETARGMDELGQLEGFNFKYRKYKSCLNAFKHGTVDVTFLTLYDFIYTQRYKQNAVVIAAQDYSFGGEKIFVRNDIQAASDLIGQTLLLQSNSISLWLAHTYLTQNGLSLNDVLIKETDGGNVGIQFKKYHSQYAAAVGWDPNFDMLQKKYGYILASTADFPEHVYDIIVVQRESLNKHGELYQKFIDQWFVAIHQKNIAFKVAEVLKVDVNEYKLSLDNVHIYQNKAESLAAFPRMKHLSNEIDEFFSGVIPKSIKRGATKEIFFKRKPLDMNLLFDISLLKSGMDGVVE